LSDMPALLPSCHRMRGGDRRGRPPPPRKSRGLSLEADHLNRVHRTRSGKKPNRNRLRLNPVGVTPREAVPHLRLLPTLGPSGVPRPPRPPDSVRSIVLRWFSDLEQRGGGYELRGARGWAHHTEASKALARVLNDDLTSLALTRGFLDRENLALPGRALGFWLYRINAQGAAAIGAPPPAPLGPNDNPSPRMIFSDAQWAALLYMRIAKTESLPARFQARETGWRTVKEIRGAASSRAHDLDVWAEDVYILERSNILEKRLEPGVGRERPIPFYRITPLGNSVRRLEWHTPAVDA
jgi:hypothetical protein